MGKIVKLSFKEQSLQEMGKWTDNSRFLKQKVGLGQLYMYIAIIFKDLLGQSKSNFIKLVFPMRYFCGGSYCFMSLCLNCFVLLAPYVCYHILS